jgi:voltage-gated potassium channel
MTVEARTIVYERWERRLEWPMLGLTFAIIPLFFAPFYLDVSSTWSKWLTMVEWGVWGTFVGELAFLLYLAPNRMPHLQRRWYELPAVFFPVIEPLNSLAGNATFLFRPLRLVRGARVARSSRTLRVFRATRLAGFASRTFVAMRRLLVQHGLQYALVLGVLLYLLSTGVVLLFERGDGNIQSYPEALWWGLATMTSLYNESDFPVTTGGRAVAVFVALLGLSLVSIITANIAAFLLQSDKDSGAQVDELKLLLDRLEAQLLAASGQDANAGPDDTPRIG